MKDDNINSRKELMKVDLSERCREIILGSILGDGSLKRYVGYKNARISIRHSEKQSEYFYWKAQQLSEVATPRSIKRLTPTGNSKSHKLQFVSAALPSLTMIHKHSYFKNTLHITRYWLNCLSPISLMIWWLDDGSIVGGGRQGVICTDGFSKEGVERLCRYLDVVWNVKCRVGPIDKDGRVYYRLWFSTNQLKNFLRLFMGYIPVKSMLYKVCLRYKDSSYQERWISEVRLAMIASENDIVQYLPVDPGSPCPKR